MKTKKTITTFLLILALIPVIYILPSIFNGSVKPYIVLSESMVPTMLVGDMIIVGNIKVENIKVGDIIAFYPGDNAGTSVSHRVIEIYEEGDEITFQTKGDNVKHKDPFIVKSKNVVGKAIFKIPYIGYLTKFSKRPILFLIFTIIPSIIIVFDEIRKIIKSPIQIRKMERSEKKRKRKENRSETINYKVLIILIIIGSMMLFYFNIPYINPGFWINFSDSPYMMSGISYIMLQVIILLMTSSLWLQNRYNKNSVKEFKKEIKRGLYNIRKTIN